MRVVFSFSVTVVKSGAGRGGIVFSFLAKSHQMGLFSKLTVHLISQQLGS